jgi:ubiquinone biosynthesis protein COQ9
MNEIVGRMAPHAAERSLAVESRAATVAKRAAVTAALDIACEAGSWDGVRMHDVAARAGLTLAELVKECPDRDALAEASFDVADDAMLALADDPGWPSLDIRERLHRSIATWLAALPPRRIVRGMIGYKLQPEHVHLQALGTARISRTVQTLREIARLRAIGWRREAEEAALTSIYLATFASWLFDGSDGAQRTLSRLARAIDVTHRVGGWSG